MPTPKQPPTTPKVKPWLKITTGIIFAILFLVIVIVIANPDEKQNATSKQADIEERKKVTEQPKFNPDEYQAIVYVMAKEFVKSSLKAPATAKFPWAPPNAVTYLHDSTFKVMSHVDAENSYGVPLRHNFILVLKYLGGDRYEPSNWDLLDIKIIEQ